LRGTDGLVLQPIFKCKYKQKMKRKYHVQRNRDKKMRQLHFHLVLIKSGFINGIYKNLKQAIEWHEK
jgi:hypothetical protein